MLDLLARHIHDDAEPPRLASLGHEFRRDEFGDGLGEVDAVDKDVDCGVSSASSHQDRREGKSS